VLPVSSQPAQAQYLPEKNKNNLVKKRIFEYSLENILTERIKII
jgi:hypothetical protein